MYKNMAALDVEEKDDPFCNKGKFQDDMTSGLKLNSRSIHKAANHAAQWMGTTISQVAMLGRSRCG